MTLSKRGLEMKQASQACSVALGTLERDNVTRLDGPIAAGELLVDDAAAAQGVQWAVIAVRGDQLRVVPTDAMSWCGKNDLDIREVNTDSHLVLRCRHPVWIDRLSDAERCGRLSAQDVLRASARVEACARDGGGGSAPTADADPDHCTWVRDTIEPLIAGLHRERNSRASGPGLGAAREPSRRAAWQPLALAASLFLGVGLGWLLHRPSTPQAATHVAAVPIGSSDAEARPLPLGFLRPRTTVRGQDEQILLLGPDAQRFALALSLDPLALADRYRIRIVTDDGHTAVEALEITRGEQLFLSFELPAAAFPPASYRLHLQALEGDEASGVGEAVYGFAVDRPSRARQAP